jgi:hypothetical protein
VSLSLSLLKKKRHDDGFRPENVAKGMITLITEGENGSVWVAEGGEPIYEVTIPQRQTLRKK